MSDGAAAIATKEIGKRKRKTDSKKNNEEKKPVSGTTNFFKNENIGRKGLGKKLKKYAHAPSINVTTSEMSTYLADTVPQAPMSSRLNEMMNLATTRRMLPNIWFSLERNIIFYGFGGKKKLIDGIVANFLKGEDVLAIDGNNGVSSVKALLSTISKSVLGSEDHAALGLILNAKHIVDQLDRHYGVSSRNEAAGEVSGKRISRDSTGPAVQRGQYKHSRPRLFIIVHDIGALQHRESQWALSILGACASVCIIATLENLNTSLLWDAEMLVRFNWIYRHMPTYQHYPMSSEFAFSKSNHYTSDENGVSGLLPTLSSLTNKHREMFEVFCENVLPLENRRMLRSDLLAVLKQKMTAKDSEELRQLLKEFLDHDIIQEMSIAKRDYLGVQLPDRELRNFLQKKAEGYFR